MPSCRQDGAIEEAPEGRVAEGVRGNVTGALPHGILSWPITCFSQPLMGEATYQMLSAAWSGHWEARAVGRAQAEVRMYVLALATFNIAIWVRNAFVLVGCVFS
jgi:hypothetical protein